MAYIFEKYTSGGGSGGGGGIIDVTELPTENIDENAVYRVTNQTAEIWFKSADFGCVKAEEFISIMSGTPIAFKIHLVDTLPQEIPAVDPTNMTFYVYIPKNTGISYINMGEGTMPLSAMFSTTDYGWTEDVNAETEDGLYTVALTTQDRYVYLNKEWVKIEAPVEPLKYTLSDDGTHYIVSANNLEFTGVINIPSTYNDLPVAEIPSLGFRACCMRGVFVPKSITKIGDQAFSACERLNSVYFEDVNAIEFGECVFGYCTAIDFPETVFAGAKIPKGAFEDCHTIDHLWVSNESSTSEFENLSTIEKGAFKMCTGLDSTWIYNEDGSTDSYYGLLFPASLKSIGSNAFWGCYGIQRIRFLGVPDTIDADAFHHMQPFVGTHNVKDIYVPWSEGAVANAPWGADNATIHYDYVEEI